MAKSLLLASPRGFCAGVERAILIVERVLEHFDEPVYVRHQIVHNRFVVNDLRNRGVIFIDQLDQVPDGAIVIFSAHGVAKEVETLAKDRGLRLFDSTCPLVLKVHLEVIRIAKAGEDCLLIGHRNHPEVIGTMGRFDSSRGAKMYLVENEQQAREIQVSQPERLHLVTQTTLSIDDTAEITAIIKRRFPNIKSGYRDICYATQNRQNAVKKLVKKIDTLIVVGSANSSNSTRLKEIGEQSGITSHLVDHPDQVQPKMIDCSEIIGLTAGASAPESLIQQIINRLQELGCEQPIDNEQDKEKVHFPLPPTVQALRTPSLDVHLNNRVGFTRQS